MRKLLISIILLSAVIGVNLFGEAFDASKYNPKQKPGLHSSTREEICLNGIWKFLPIYDKKPLWCDEFPDKSYPPEVGEWVDILVPGHYKERMKGYSGMRLPDGKLLPDKWKKANRVWYKRSLQVPENWQGKEVDLRFDGVAFYCKVFVNNQAVGEHQGPGTPFSFDISDKLKYGQENTISVYVIDKRKVVRIPAGTKGYQAAFRTMWRILPEQWEYRRDVAGIWRDVFIEVKDKLNVNDIFAMPSFRKKEITGRIEVKNSSGKSQVCRLEVDILDLKGNKVLKVGKKDISLFPGKIDRFDLTESWKNPKLWDIDEPNLYYMRAKLVDYSAKKKIIDEKLVRFGFRETWVDKDQIYLNGHILHILGDWDCSTGMSHPLTNQRYEVNIMKFKALREDLNIVAPRMIMRSTWESVFDAADDVGFPLIVTGYSGSNIDPTSWPELFKEWQDTIRAIRNHPSIVIYSVENESMSHQKTNSLYMLQRRLDQILVETDPTRPYYHDGHASWVPEDPGAIYENGDLCGTAPMSGGHYTVHHTPVSRWMHEFDRWRRKKPFMYGEAGTFGGTDILAYARLFFGEETFGKEYDELNRLAGRASNNVVGSWRSYAVPMINPHGTYCAYLTSYRGYPGKTDLKWDDLTTPGPKVASTAHCSFDPYSNNRTQLGVYGKSMQKTLAPLLVTLQRHLRHNYFSGEKAEKIAFIINDTKKDMNVELTWKLKESGTDKIVKGHKTDVLVKQGIPKKATWAFDLPSASELLALTLEIEVKSKDGKRKSSDIQEISVYPKDPVPKLKKKYFVYVSEDQKNTLEKWLTQTGVKAEPFSNGIFEGKVDDKVLIVGPYSFDKKLKDYYPKIDKFIKDGGVMLVMSQKCTLPLFNESSNLNTPALDHPLARGLRNSRSYFWAGKDNLTAEFAFDLPQKGNFLKHFYMHSPHMYQQKKTYLFEMPKGKGCVIGCNLILEKRYDIEPEAQLLTHNLFRFIDSYKRNLVPVFFLTDKELDPFLTELEKNGVKAKPVSPKNLGSLKNGVLIVRSAKELTPNKKALDDFVNQGGTLFLLPQDEKNWDGTFFNNELKLTKVKPMNCTYYFDHIYKEEQHPLFYGSGSFLFDLKKAVEVVKDSNWHKNFKIFHPDKKRAQKEKLYGVVWKDQGEGKIILDQIPTKEIKMGHTLSREGKNLFLNILCNLGVNVIQPDDWEYMAIFQMVKESFAEVTKLTPEMKDKFKFINLKFHMNGVFDGKKFNADVTVAKFRKVPKGLWVYAGVPFHVVDADGEELLGGDWGAPNSVIVLKGKRKPTLPESVENIPVKCKAKRLYFLHASSWAISIKEAVEDPNYDVLTYRIHYKDGKTKDVVAKNNIHIRDYWIKVRNFKGDLPKAKLAWGERILEMQYALATMWIQTWNNPEPDKEIQSIDIISANNSAPLIYAITAEK